MVRIVNGNIVEDDNRNGAGANAAPATGGTAFAGGSFLAHLAQPVEIYGYHTVRCVTSNEKQRNSVTWRRGGGLPAPLWPPTWLCVDLFPFLSLCVLVFMVELPDACGARPCRGCLWRHEVGVALRGRALLPHSQAAHHATQRRSSSSERAATESKRRLCDERRHDEHE